jgi:hypothetical protein
LIYLKFEGKIATSTFFISKQNNPRNILIQVVNSSTIEKRVEPKENIPSVYLSFLNFSSDLLQMLSDKNESFSQKIKLFLDFLPDDSNICQIIQDPHQFVSSFLILDHHFQIDYYLEILSKYEIEYNLIPQYIETGFHNRLIYFLEIFPSSASSISNILYIFLFLNKQVGNKEFNILDHQKIVDLSISPFSKGGIKDQISVVKLLSKLPIDPNQKLSKIILDCLNHCSPSSWPYLQIFLKKIVKDSDIPLLLTPPLTPFSIELVSDYIKQPMPISSNSQIMENLYKIFPIVPYNSIKTSFSYLNQLSEYFQSISIPITKIAQQVFLSCYKSKKFIHHKEDLATCIKKLFKTLSFIKGDKFDYNAELDRKIDDVFVV